MMAQTISKSLHKIRLVSEFVFKIPEPEDLCRFLALQIDLSGELANIYIGRLDTDGILRTISSFGYSQDDVLKFQESPLKHNWRAYFALQHEQNLIFDEQSTAFEFCIDNPTNSLTECPSTVAIAVLNKFLYVIELRANLHHSKEEELYYDAIKSLLCFYSQNAFASSKSASSERTWSKGTIENRKNYLFGNPLTARQEMILALINKGDTNTKIASQLGYSESLIRQETIIIYAKLGIRGRRDLKQAN